MVDGDENHPYYGMSEKQIVIMHSKQDEFRIGRTRVRVDNKSIADLINGKLYKGSKVRTAITVRNVIYKDMRSRGENRELVPWASAEQVNKMVDGDKNHPYYGMSEKQIVIMHSKQDEFRNGSRY